MAGMWVTYKAKSRCWAELGDTASGLEYLRNEKNPTSNPEPCAPSDLEYSWGRDHLSTRRPVLPNEDIGMADPNAPSGAEGKARGKPCRL